MSDKTGIEWADATWNPIVGCSVLSPGCTNCYAMKFAGARLQHLPAYAGLTQMSKAGPVWTGEVRLQASALDQPSRWRKPRRIFVNSMGDTFHERATDQWLDLVFAEMERCPHHIFLVLTKRPARACAYLAQRPVLPNVWLGASAEDQARHDERLGFLASANVAKRFVSAEPLLGPIDIDRLTPIDWLIAGGESGRGSRPVHPDWVRALRDQCAASDIPFFFKQWGEYLPHSQTPWDHQGAHTWRTFGKPSVTIGEEVAWRAGKKAAGNTLDGRTHLELPAQ